MQACWECPSNIALVKYWGKKEEQLPLNPSLSFSLKNSRTRTRVQLFPKSKEKLIFLFEGHFSSFSERIEQYLDLLSRNYLPWINDFSFHIESENTFPHSAGIASSASGFGALALCLADLDNQIGGADNKKNSFVPYKQEITEQREQFFLKVSQLARLGSGSACRSVFPGFAWWGRSRAISGSSDFYAVPVPINGRTIYNSLRDAILLVDSGKKKVSSAAGHDLMKTHPYKEGRIIQANANAELLLRLMRTDDYLRFFKVVEHEALSLHALMMSSTPSFLLLKPESLTIIEKIRSFREQTGMPVGFTIDAGPNIHFLYFEEYHQEILHFIKSELLSLLENERWLDDGLGEGPIKVE